MGRICSGCHKDLSKAKFSSKQWGANENQRRCKNCTANNIQSTPLPETQDGVGIPHQMFTSNRPLVKREPVDYIDEEYARQKLASQPDDISCWICLEEKDLSPTERPLLRDCSCRGDHSGWAHYKCLALYSTDKIDSIFENAATSGMDMDPGEFEGIWTCCPNCHQSYQNDLRLATSAGYVKYIEEKDILDPRMMTFLRVESHMALLIGLKCALHLDDAYISEVGQLAKMIRKKLLPKIKNSSLVPQQRQLELEADLYRNGLSYDAEMNGDLEAAIEYEKRAIELFEVLGSGAIPLLYKQDYEAKIATEQDEIDRLQKLLEGVDDELEGDEDVSVCEKGVDMVELEKCRRLYELSMRDAGEFSHFAISKGVNYAELLYKSSIVKSERLATKLFENSMRIFGPEHWVTEKAKETYEMTIHRGLSVLHPDCGMLQFDFLGWDRQKDLYILKPPESADDEEQSKEDRYKKMRGKTVCAPRSTCVLTQRVPVLVLGLPPGPLQHINGKIGETKMFSISEDSTERNFLGGYTIQFEDEDVEDCEVPPGNVLILGKLPPENAMITTCKKPDTNEGTMRETEAKKLN